ncbi:hypothetical protein RMR21_025810 (plasmid) [Agrobacterium sp. rho-8.1]|nr:hypothetical protein [Agrobacterium sp. rho-8.1]
METQLLKCLVIRNDLDEAAVEVRNKGLIRAIAHLKTAFIAFHNLNDFEKTLRSLYREHRDLSTSYKHIEKAVEFFSYLRNRFAGHLVDELVEMALIWKPEILMTLNRDHDANIVLIYNFWLLETAIDTCVDPDEANRFFESETDFNFPPDEKRFHDTRETACCVPACRRHLIKLRSGD